MLNGCALRLWLHLRIEALRSHHGSNAIGSGGSSRGERSVVRVCCVNATVTARKQKPERAFKTVLTFWFIVQKENIYSFP